MPPVSPMLSKSVATIPSGTSYEPKWDGFRSICFRDRDEVELGSRNERPMTRYFPELVAATTAELPERCVIDGEIVIATERGLDFEALQQRIHPADSRVRMLAEPDAGFLHRVRLARAGRCRLHRTTVSRAPRRPRRRVGRLRSLDPRHAGDHRSGDRTALVRRVRGSRARRSHRQAADDHLSAGQACHVQDQALADRRLRGRGLPRAQVRRTTRSARYCSGSTRTTAHSPRSASSAPSRWPSGSRLFTELQSLVTTFDDHPWNWAAHKAGERTPRRNEGSRWNAGKDLSFVPLRPERVVEVRYDHMEGATVPPHRAVQPLAPRPRPTLLHLCATRTAAHLQPRRHRSRPRTGRWLMRSQLTAHTKLPVTEPL